jgi:hypothetical protein
LAAVVEEHLKSVEQMGQDKEVMAPHLLFPAAA